MKLLEWQKRVMDETDLSIFEIVSVRNSGKTVLSLAWLAKDCDVAIMLTSHPSRVRHEIPGILEEYGINGPKIHVVGNLDQMRNIHTHEKKKVKIVVDEYFALPNITLDALDKAIGHEKYKVMFIGTRIKETDKFKIPFSKQYAVDLVHLLSEKIMTPKQLQEIMNHLDSDQLHIEFGTPLESN